MAADESKEKAETKKWLQLVDGLDYSAKVLIRYCLVQAAQAALDKSKEWVALVEAAGIDEGAELPVVRFVTSESDLLKATELGNADQNRLKDQIKRLDGFKKMAAGLATDLRKRLKKSDPPVS